MHDITGKNEGPAPGRSGGPAEADLQSYELVRLGDKSREKEAFSIEARDLHDAIGRARREIGVGEVRIMQDGRQLCFLHLKSATTWWVEVNESPNPAG